MVNHQTAHHKINFRFRNLLQKNWPISWKDMDHVSTFSQVDNGQKITFLTAVNHKKTFDEEFTVSQGWKLLFRIHGSNAVGLGPAKFQRPRSPRLGPDCPVKLYQIGHESSKKSSKKSRGHPNRTRTSKKSVFGSPAARESLSGRLNDNDWQSFDGIWCGILLFEETDLRKFMKHELGFIEVHKRLELSWTQLLRSFWSKYNILQ